MIYECMGGIVDALAILSERDEIHECKEHIIYFPS